MRASFNWLGFSATQNQRLYLPVPSRRSNFALGPNRGDANPYYFPRYNFRGIWGRNIWTKFDTPDLILKGLYSVFESLVECFNRRLNTAIVTIRKLALHLSLKIILLVVQVTDHSLSNIAKAGLLKQGGLNTDPGQQRLITRWYLRGLTFSCATLAVSLIRGCMSL